MSGSIKREFSDGVTMMSIAIWIEQAILFAMFIVYARLLGAETVGVAMMAISVVLLGETLVRESFGDFLIQRVDLESGHLNATFWLLSGLAVIVIGGFWLAAPFIAAAYDEPRVTDLLRGASVTVLFVALAAVPVSNLRRRMAFKTLAVRTVLGPVVGGCAGVAAAFAGWGAWSLVIQRVVQGAVTDGLVFATERWRPSFEASRRQFAEVWRFSARMLGVRAIDAFTIQTPSYAIGVLLGPAAVALYTAAWRLVDALAFLIVAPIRYVSQPAFAALRRGEEAGATLLHDVSHAASLITFSSFAGVAAVAPALLEVLLGEEWVAAAPILQMLALVGLYTTIERVHESFCLAMGHASAMLRFVFAEAVIGVALCFLAAPHGAFALAAAVTVRCLLIWPFRVHFTTRLAKVDTYAYVRAFAGPAVFALLMAAAVTTWRLTIAYSFPPIIDLASSILIGAGLYAALCWMFMRDRVLEAAALLKITRSPAPSPAAVAELDQTQVSP